LETSLEPLEGNRVKLTVTVSADEVEAAVSAAYNKYAREVRVPGFRKGHAPRPILDTFVGQSQILATAQESLLDETYPAAIDQEKVRPIDSPDVGELDGLVDGEPFVYTAELELRPKLTISSVDGLAITVPPGVASDEEIDTEIDTMRGKFATLEVVEDRGIEEGDFALVSFVGLVEGEPFEGNTVDKYLYELGRGLMPKEFDDALIGAKPGDAVQSVFTIPETTSMSQFIGKEASFDITVHEVKTKVLPPLDEEFAANAGGFDTVEDVRADVRKKLDERKAFGRMRDTERRALEALAERMEGEAPEAMVIAQRDRMLREFFNNLQQDGVSLKDYVSSTGVDPERIQADIEAEARIRVRHELALEALFRMQGLEVTDADVDAELADIAQSADKTADELRASWEEAGILAVLEEQVMQRKSVEWLLDHVEMTEETPETSATAEPADEKPPAKGRKPKKKEE
jgi:trigger factor